MSNEKGHPPSKNRILLVDDDAGLRWAVARWLERSFEVRHAENGAEAWEMLTTSSEPFLVVTDNKMPGLKGGDLLRRICKERVQTIGAILMSGDANLEDEIAALSAEFKGNGVPFFFLSKPFSSQELFSHLKKIDSVGVDHLQTGAQ